MSSLANSLIALTVCLSLAASAPAQSPYETYAGLGTTGNASRGAAPSVGISWQSDLEAAKAAATQADKLVLVHFWTPSCRPCRLLENQVFNQPAVARAVAQQFVPVKINAEEAQQLAQNFGVTKVPTDIILTADGKPVDRMTSPNTPMAYVGRLMNAVAKAETKSGANFQLASAAAPYNQSNSPYGNLSVPPAASPSSTPGAAPKTPASTAQTAAASQVNPYATRGQSATDSRYGVAPPAAPSKPQLPTAAQLNNPYASQPATRPTNQPTNKPTVPTTNTAATTTAPAAASAAVTNTKPTLPPGAPPVGFDGHCPVTLVKARKWVYGDAAWGAIHEGRTYLFVGQAERDTFLKSPEVYSPVLSGVDPVVAIDTGRAVPGKREFGAQHEDRIYLFSSQDSLKRFMASPTRYTTGVRQAMNRAANRTVR